MAGVKGRSGRITTQDQHWARAEAGRRGAAARWGARDLSAAQMHAARLVADGFLIEFATLPTRLTELLKGHVTAKAIATVAAALDEALDEAVESAADCMPGILDALADELVERAALIRERSATIMGDFAPTNHDHPPAATAPVDPK